MSAAKSLKAMLALYVLETGKAGLTEAAECGRVALAAVESYEARKAYHIRKATQLPITEDDAVYLAQVHEHGMDTIPVYIYSELGSVPHGTVGRVVGFTNNASRPVRVRLGEHVPGQVRTFTASELYPFRRY